MTIAPLRLLRRPTPQLNHSAYPCPTCHTPPLTAHTGRCADQARHNRRPR